MSNRDFHLWNTRGIQFYKNTVRNFLVRSIYIRSIPISLYQSLFTNPFLSITDPFFNRMITGKIRGVKILYILLQTIFIFVLIERKRLKLFRQIRSKSFLPPVVNVIRDSEFRITLSKSFAHAFDCTVGAPGLHR